MHELLITYNAVKKCKLLIVDSRDSITFQSILQLLGYYYSLSNPCLLFSTIPKYS